MDQPARSGEKLEQLKSSGTTSRNLRDRKPPTTRKWPLSDSHNSGLNDATLRLSYPAHGMLTLFLSYHHLYYLPLGVNWA
eukprot:1331761-Rhodomonas_salina.1